MSGAIIVGAGPGIGVSVARRFAREGLPVGLLARSAATVADAVAAVTADGGRAVGARADVTDEAGLRAALDRVTGELGAPDVLVYNVGLIQADAPGELSVERHAQAWAINVVGAITAATHLGPGMVAAGRGSILLTGGMPRPDPAVTSLSLGKAGLRALTDLLAQSYGPAGVHVATVTVGGAVAPGTTLDPDLIAEHYWRLHAQATPDWELQVTLNP